MSDIVGVRPLIALRQMHRKPELVFLHVGYKPQSVDIRFPWHIYNSIPDLFVPEPNVRVDLRPLVGLDVIMFAASLSAEIYSMFERLQEYVKRVTVSIADLPADVMVWDRQHGQHMLGDIANG